MALPPHVRAMLFDHRLPLAAEAVPSRPDWRAWVHVDPERSPLRRIRLRYTEFPTAYLEHIRRTGSRVSYGDAPHEVLVYVETEAELEEALRPWLPCPAELQDPTTSSHPR